MAYVRYVRKSQQKRNVDGRRLCLVCDGELPKRRSSYCSDDHADRNTPSWMRGRVFQRDRGQCALCPTKIPWRSGEWEMDHIVPVSEGGGLCGIDGYRTLCKVCHGRESGALRRRLNERKRLAKIQRETGKLFN